MLRTRLWRPSFRRAASYTACGYPLVDVSALQQPRGTASRAAAVASLATACTDHGFFYAAKCDALPAAYIASIYEYSRRAHALPPSVKDRFKQRGGTGAYSGPDIGQPELNYEASTAAPTVCGWDYSRVRFSLGSGQGPQVGGDTATGDARYPSATDGLSPPFATVMDDLYERQNALGRVLLAGFEDALGLAPRALTDMFEGDAEGDFGTIRLLHYPGAPRDGAVVGAGGDATGGRAGERTGIGAHTDFECFTLMHQNAPGLQLMPRVAGGGHGDWVDAPVREAEFIVIIGDMLERLTNGHLRATPHRVQLTEHERSSIIRFNGFAPETLVAPLSEFVSPERSEEALMGRTRCDPNEGPNEGPNETPMRPQ